MAVVTTALGTLGCGEQPGQVTVTQPTPPQTQFADNLPVSAVSMSNVSWKPRVTARDWQAIVIHHTASRSGSVESIQLVHQQRKDAAGNPWRGIGYHFVIGNGLGMDDGDKRLTWAYAQRTGKPQEYAAEVVVEWAA